MEVSKQAQLMFHGVNFPIINFDSRHTFPKNRDPEINISIDPKVFYPKEKPNIFRVVQSIHLSSKDFFDLRIVAVGTFELKEGIDQKQKKSFVNLNAPAIMFPYIRAFISTLTSNLGNITGTLTIPTQFFKGELPEIKSLEEEE